MPVKNLLLLALSKFTFYSVLRTERIDKKENKIFLIHKEIHNGAVAKLYMTNGHLIYKENICAFPHILGNPSSYMTLQLLHSEFPYI